MPLALVMSRRASSGAAPARLVRFASVLLIASIGAFVVSTRFVVTRPALSAHPAFLVEQHATLLQRTLAWQQEIYSDPVLPPWLREVLLNMLHTYTEGGFWAAAEPPIIRPGAVRTGCTFPLFPAAGRIL